MRIGFWKRSLALALIAGASLGASAVGSTPPEYDLVIRNGKVLDGTGSPWVRADVAIEGDRFVRIGHVAGRGTVEVDAAGDFVTPGWIDMMDQSGEVLQTHGDAANKLVMGVTTAVAGEGGIPVRTEQLRAYFEGLERNGISLNFGTYYGTTNARVEVMGEGAGTPTPAQMEAMRAKVAEAMEAGALGVATALAYPPDSFQTTAEITELARVAGGYGGIYASHIRDESRDLVISVREAIAIGEAAGTKVEIFHFKAASAEAWGRLLPEAGRVIEEARARGIDVAADLYPYRAGGTGLSSTVPNWVFAEGMERGFERLRDPALRTRLKAEIEAGHQPGWQNLIISSNGWDGIMLVAAYNPRYDRFHHQSIAQIARQLGRHPADVAWDIVLEALPRRARALYFMMSEDDIATALRFPWTSIGSDAGASEELGMVDAIGLAHPRAYGTFPRIIAEYVRRRGVISLPEAIRKMTSWPAARMGFSDRGLIREGMKADVTIFNYERIQDRATWEQPTLTPTGIDHVIVNGVVVVRDGRHTGARPGQVLRGPGYRPPAAANAPAGAGRWGSR